MVDRLSRLLSDFVFLLTHRAMIWPPWSTKTKEDHVKSNSEGRLTPSSTITDWSQWTSPNTIIPTIVLTSTILISTRLYYYYLRQFSTASNISDAFWRKRSLFGKVTSVGDGDGFRMFHTPGGRLMGWGWLPGRKIPTGRALKDKTVRTV